MAYSLDVGLALGAANTGLTLEAQIVDTAGVNVGAAITTGFVEFGASGNYLWHTAAMPDGHRGGVVFQVSPGGTEKAFVAINPEEVETAAVVWDAVLADHQDAGSTGEALGDAGGAGLTAADVWTHTPRTLTGFGTLVADVAAAVWGFATRTLTTAIAAVSPPPVITGDKITLLRGDTITIPFTGLGSLAGRTKLWFTLKRSAHDTDAEAIVQIEETAGLLRLNGAVATAVDGDITVSDEDEGDISVALAAVAADDLPTGTKFKYDVQMLVGATVSTLTSGEAEILLDVTRATS